MFEEPCPSPKQAIIYPYYGHISSKQKVYTRLVDFKMAVQANMNHPALDTHMLQHSSESQETPTLIIFLALNNTYNIIHFSYDIFVQSIQLWLI